MEEAVKYLWNEFNALGPFLSSRKTRLVLLDFDGTLAPIAAAPEAVRLDRETRRILANLNKPPHDTLAILSGRSLKEVSSLVRLKNVIYAGNHGLEINGRGFKLPPKAREARKLRKFIKLLAQKFRMAFGSFQGILVEDKNFTLSLHFRRLPAEQAFLFNRLVRFFREKYEKYPLVWVRGKKVWEIRPRVYWGKGDTALYLLQKIPGAFPLAIGDDVSDEDMFKAIAKRGIAIRVGNSKTSEADYYLKSPSEVRVFLENLSR